MNLTQVINDLRHYDRDVKIMEVCGTHTSSIVKNGIKELISPTIKLVSGPGCPVCVTPSSYIDILTEHACKAGYTVLSFGDMFKVKGSKYSLSEAKATGASVELMYSPLEAVNLATENPETIYVVAAVGFETTIPIYAVLLDEMIKKEIKNVRILTSLKTMIPALEYICENEEIDAFLCPGHVSVVIGSNAYNSICKKHKKPFVISGFEAEHILAGIYNIVCQKENGLSKVENMYKSVVSPKGQSRAMNLVDQYFVKINAFWRGIGEIKGSGLVIKEEYAFFDLGSKDIKENHIQNGCRCADVILGRMDPDQCELFAKICCPANPIGPCMVSSEGACGIWYGNSRHQF